MFLSQKITCFGSSTRDVFISIRPSYFGDKLCFEPGSKIPIDDIGFFSGGGATNTAIGFSRLGFKAAIVSAIGKDEDGLQIKSELKSSHVDTANLIEEKKRTPYSAILTGFGKDRVILHYSGATALLGTHHEINWRKISSEWIYLSSLHQNDTHLLEKIFSHGKKINAKVAWNIGQTEISLGLETLFPFLEKTQVLILNSAEALSLTGKAGIEKNLASLSQFAKIVAITNGASGAHASMDGEFFYAKPFQVKVVDVTGAGDAFACAFVAAIARQKGFQTALEYGCANASSIVQFLGAKNKLLSEKEISEFIKTHKHLK